MKLDHRRLDLVLARLDYWMLEAHRQKEMARSLAVRLAAAGECLSLAAERGKVDKEAVERVMNGVRG